MPRGPRLDAPATLHHVMVRGIERRRIFETDRDREDFLDRLGRVIQEGGARCLAWVLIPNHAHILLRTGLTPLAGMMRRILGGGSFVEEVLSGAERIVRERVQLRRRGVDVEGVMDFIGKELGVTREEILGGVGGGRSVRPDRYSVTCA